MANVEDYLPGGKNDPDPLTAAPVAQVVPQAGGFDALISDADTQQQARIDATPVNWEERYKNLEVLNSQQAQTVGSYRNIIDEFITNPTPAPEPVVEALPITQEQLYDNPDETISNKINAAVESHPAIIEAREIKQVFEAQAKASEVAGFKERHPDAETIYQSSEFGVWVQGNPTRIALANGANAWDMNSADALFSLYKAENGISQMTTQAQEAQAISAASLESCSSLMAPEPSKYSRGDYVATLTRAKQGDLEAEAWIQRNAAGYREALTSGNVRD